MLRYGDWDDQTFRAELVEGLRRAESYRERSFYARMLSRSAAKRGASPVAQAKRFIRLHQHRASRSSSSRQPSASGDDGGDGDPEPAPAVRIKPKATQTIIVGKTRNEKLGIGKGYVTLAPVEGTCSPTCPFMRNGCLARRGPGGHNARLERNAKREGLTALDLAKEEASLIALFAARLRRRRRELPLRIHYSGDSATSETARIVSAACATWPGPTWTYSHAWREVARADWGPVSVLASVDLPEHAHEAMARGYAPAIVVPTFPNGKKPWKEAGISWIPCLFETRGTTCVECRLCFDADGLLRRRQGIAFEAHGSGAHKVREALVQLRRKSTEGTP
ncbi:MAG: hypothetical protein U0174_03570 [Polyangiaceae bacterium]